MSRSRSTRSALAKLVVVLVVEEPQPLVARSPIRRDVGVSAQDGQPMVPESLPHKSPLIERISALPRVTFHELRHTHASQLHGRREHPKVVPERLGHPTIAPRSRSRWIFTRTS
jgi:hypothetical protein